MQEDKGKKFAYLVIAVAAGLILNEVAPTSFIKTQMREKQERTREDGQYKFGLNSNSFLNAKVASAVLDQYQLENRNNGRKKKNNKDGASSSDILELAGNNAQRAIKKFSHFIPK